MQERLAMAFSELNHNKQRSVSMKLQATGNMYFGTCSVPHDVAQTHNHL